MPTSFHVPLPLLTDSYKTTHFLQYPPVVKMVAYGEFRCSFDKDPEDHRVIFYGIRHIIENYIDRKWTQQDVDLSEAFFKTHLVGFRSYPWPKDLFQKVVDECDGYFPVKIEAIPEGSVIYPHTPVVVITAEKEYAPLATYLETILDLVWYPSTVATLSRRCKSTIQSAFERSVDPDQFFLLESRLHDFGFRGCTTIEQAMIGGSAHLLNFSGTDTLVAAYYTQYTLNGGVPVGTSIPASEHSVMTCFNTEQEAMLHMIGQFGSDIFACVMDSYDYLHALDTVLPSIASAKIARGGMMVLRPDSGDPVKVVLQALKATEKVFGTTINSKGFKVVQGVSVIQGDGICHSVIVDILAAVLAEGFSAQNVAFGMGGGLLQRVNRDTMSFAIKLSQATCGGSGEIRDIMKAPKTDFAKYSLPGEFTICASSQGPAKVHPKQANKANLLSVVYDAKPRPEAWQEPFSALQKRIETQWNAFPKLFEPVSEEMKDKVKQFMTCKETTA